MKLVAIIGMSGSGKSIITDYLESQNWKKVYFGGITYQLMEKAGIERTPDGKSEKEFRESLRKKYGDDCYARFLEPEIREAIKHNNVVLDGLYSWYEYKYLIERFPDLKLICMIIDKKIRYQRIASRPDRSFDHDAVVYRDIAEIENLYKGGPIAYADYYICNNGTKEEAIEKLKKILEEVCL